MNVLVFGASGYLGGHVVRRGVIFVDIALAQVALTDVAAAMEEEGVEVADIPEFVLAHPAHEIARVAGSTLAGT